MRAKWRCPCVSLALLLAYTIGSLLFLSPPSDPVGAGAITDGSTTRTTWGPRIRASAGADSIVFIALGPAARSAALLYALSSLREEGRWDGPVHVIVEREGDLDCLLSHLKSSVTVIALKASGGGGGGDGGDEGDDDGDDEVRGETSGGTRSFARVVGRGGGGGGGGGGEGVGGGVAINAKLIKMQLFDLLPANIRRVVYVDCDVITRQPLGPYLDAVALEWSAVSPPPIRVVMAREQTVAARDEDEEPIPLPSGSSSSSLQARDGRSTEGPRLPPQASQKTAATVAAKEAKATAAAAARVKATATATETAGTKGGTAATAAAAAAAGMTSTIVIFPDAGGHTFPDCAGCDVAHSGVVAISRGRSELCLQLWHDAFAGKGEGGGGSWGGDRGGGGGGVRGGGGSGGRGDSDSTGTATDQEALDIAIREGSGCEARWVDTRHLHFMKDVFVIAGLTRRSTFAHFTGLLHPEGLSNYYRRHYEWSLGRGFDEWGHGEMEACAVG